MLDINPSVHQSAKSSKFEDCVVHMHICIAGQGSDGHKAQQGYDAVVCRVKSQPRLMIWLHSHICNTIGGYYGITLKTFMEQHQVYT